MCFFSIVPLIRCTSKILHTWHLDFKIYTLYYILFLFFYMFQKRLFLIFLGSFPSICCSLLGHLKCSYIHLTSIFLFCGMLCVLMVHFLPLSARLPCSLSHMKRWSLWTWRSFWCHSWKVETRPWCRNSENSLTMTWRWSRSRRSVAPFDTLFPKMCESHWTRFEIKGTKKTNKSTRDTPLNKTDKNLSRGTRMLEDGKYKLLKFLQPQLKEECSQTVCLHVSERICLLGLTHDPLGRSELDPHVRDCLKSYIQPWLVVTRR